MECPVCSSVVDAEDLDRHVNDHLDRDELERDRSVAKQLASAPPSPAKDFGCAVVQSSSYAFCTKGCGQSIPLTEWESHLLVHELEEENHADACVNNNVGECSSSSQTPHCREVWNVGAVISSQERDTLVPVEEGLISLLRKCLLLEQQRPSAYALTSYVQHFESTNKQDLGWGCGWRNIQMLSSYLMEKDEEWRKVLYGGTGFIPTISALQKWLEIAWSKGYDPDGAEHFNGTIYGSQKWIGTTECAALLRSFGVRAQIVDFKAISRGNNGTKGKQVPRKTTWKRHKDMNKGRQALHWNVECNACGMFPIRGTRFKSVKRADYDLCFKCVKNQPGHAHEFEKIEKPTSPAGGDREDVNHQRLVDWVWNYYTEDEELKLDNSKSPSITVGKRPPLYFQHQGHSRTIIGIQRRKRIQVGPEEAFLLILDPSHRTEELASALRAGVGWQKLIKRGVHTLKRPEYQLCYVDPGIAQGKELEVLKNLTSTSFLY